MSNFFNAIGVADMEKVHSGVIGWMLSDDCTALGSIEKSELLCSLFEITPFCVFDEIKVRVEVYDIDILITTKIRQIEECWVIENKLKSNQHDNQLDKYVRIINGLEMTKEKSPKPITDKYQHIESKNQHYCVLSLIEEDPLGDYKNKWINTKYIQIKDTLKDFVKGLSKDNNDEYAIIKEYVNCLEFLTNALSEFQANPQEYPIVFKDGNKKKDEKDEEYLNGIATKYGQNARFISQNGLETIFQKCLLGNRWKACRYYGNYSLVNKWIIDDSRGTAKLSITLNECPEYISGIEFQNGSFKFQLLKIKDSSDDKLKKWKNLLIEIKDKNSNIKWRVNPPKNKSSYISISHSVDNWWQMDANTLNSHFEKCYKIGEVIINEARKRGIIQ